MHWPTYSDSKNDSSYRLTREFEDLLAFLTFRRHRIQPPAMKPRTGHERVIVSIHDTDPITVTFFLFKINIFTVLLEVNCKTSLSNRAYVRSRRIR